MTNPQTPPSDDNARTGAKLVRASRWLLLGGLLTCFGGCGLAAVAHSGLPALIGCGLGFGVIVTAAVVGQVGRAHQGRVI